MDSIAAIICVQGSGRHLSQELSVGYQEVYKIKNDQLWNMLPTV